MTKLLLIQARIFDFRLMCFSISVNLKLILLFDVAYIKVDLNSMLHSSFLILTSYNNENLKSFFLPLKAVSSFSWAQIWTFDPYQDTSLKSVELFGKVPVTVGYNLYDSLLLGF